MSHEDLERKIWMYVHIALFNLYVYIYTHIYKFIWRERERGTAKSSFEASLKRAQHEGCCRGGEQDMGRD